MLLKIFHSETRDGLSDQVNLFIDDTSIILVDLKINVLGDDLTAAVLYTRSDDPVYGTNPKSYKTTKLKLYNVEDDEDDIYEALQDDLGFTSEEVMQIMENPNGNYYLNATIIVDENLKIIGGEVEPEDKPLKLIKS